MNHTSKESMRKYLRFHYWSRYLRQHGILSEREYQQIISKLRAQYGIQ